MAHHLPQLLSWISNRTPLTRKSMERHQSTQIKHATIAYIGHIEPKMVPHLLYLKERGIELLISPCVPSVSDAESIDYLQARGIQAFGERSGDVQSLKEHWKIISSRKPNFVFEMGGKFLRDSILLDHELVAACECTGSGISLLEGLNVKFPIFNLDDVPLKRWMHNRYEVGNAAWFTFRELTRLDVSRMNVGIVGFGPVGQGMACTARGLGGRVWVADLDPIARACAESEGFNTSSLEEMIPNLDVIVTATGQRDILNHKNLSLAKNGLIVANVGHDAFEVDMSGAQKGTTVLPLVDEYLIGSKKVYLLAEGRLLNLATGKGSPINTFDVFTALSIEAMMYMISEGKLQSPGLQLLPAQVAEQIDLFSSRSTNI